MAPVQLVYGNWQGRGEPIRIALAYKGIDWVEPPYSEVVKTLHTNLDSYPFRQVPRYIDEDVDIVQSQAILRHVGRKHGLYGSNLRENAEVDQVIEGFVELRDKLRTAVQGDDAAKQQYNETIAAPAEKLVTLKSPGGGIASLERLLSKNNNGVFVGNDVTIADLLVFTLTDLHFGLGSGIIADHIRTTFPLLTKQHAKISANPGVAAYLKSARRNEAAWGFQLKK